MKIDIKFDKIERNKKLEDYAHKKFSTVISDFLGEKDSHLKIWLIDTSTATNKSANKYKCEVNLRFAPKNDMFVDKSGNDALDAINQAAASLHNMLRSKIKKQQDKRNQ